MQQGTKAEHYQVFINHRGEDTKRNIASLIYHKLKSYGLQVFWDKDGQHTGNTICSALQEAIGSSSVRIAIFSKNYAHSTWCLAELCWMLKPSHDSRVIPVFYDVEPADLRHIERGPYAQAFSKHRQRLPMEVVNEWREALKAAASIFGLPFKTNESDYGEFVEKIGNMVIKLVRWDPLEVAAHPVGLQQTLKDLDDHIQKQSSTKVIVLAGLGGIGKSTLAKYIFNLRCSEFNRASYLCNVRETTDLTSLQRQLLSDLRGLNRDIHNTFIGKPILRNSLKGLKILIVLDDVDDREKIKSVVDLDAVEPGSLILITSRYKDIMGGSSASTLLYDVKPLKRNHARELFCHHAFRQLNPPEKYEDSVEDFLKMCGGLPLSLEVFGEQLAGKLDRTYWKRQLELYFEGQPLIEADTVINALKWSSPSNGD